MTATQTMAPRRSTGVKIILVVLCLAVAVMWIYAFFFATDIIAKMESDIVAIPVATDRDRQLLAVFDQQYKLVIADRRRYTASLRAGKYVQYSETLSAGGPVSNVVLDFTAGVKGNDVPDCSPPGELGGEISP